jgi:hypothetical protein
MAKLIDGSALLREMRKEQRECEADGAKYGGEAILFAEAFDDACEIIKRAPKVDAVEIVRCKDCKWFARGKVSNRAFCHGHIGVTIETAVNGYCYLGERQSNG